MLADTGVGIGVDAPMGADEGATGYLPLAVLKAIGRTWRLADIGVGVSVHGSLS